MLKRLAACALWLALAGPAHAISPHPLAHPVQPVPEGGVTAAYYSGGTHTLPFGVANGTIVLDHLHTMAFLQPAIEEMLRRGYIRRMDLDAAATHDGYSSALLAFERPGVPVDREEPILLVITKPYWLVENGWIPVTQVMGGTVCDSAGVVFTRTSPADSALAMIGITDQFAVSPGAQPRVNDDDLDYRYTAHESANYSGFTNHMSRGTQCMWNHWGQRMAVAGAGGAIGGSMGALSSGQFGWQSIAARATVGAAIAMWTANENFWISPPDTASCQ